MYYAYYYSKITWEATIEHQGGHSRQCSRNIQLDIKYLGCSEGTPEEYIPQNEQDVHQTYPDIEGAWVKDPDSNNVDSNTGGSNSGNEDSSYNNDYSDSKQKDYLYVAHVICDSEKGDSDDLYIYKKNGGSKYALLGYTLLKDWIWLQLRKYIMPTSPSTELTTSIIFARMVLVFILIIRIYSM